MPSRGVLRSQLLPIGAPASACPRRHLLTGRPWRLVEASCTLGPTLCAALLLSLPQPARRRADLGSWRGWDSNPRSRAHEAREDSHSSTAQVWPAGVEPAVSGARSRRGGLLPHSQTIVQSTPGGTRTRSFRVEGPASSPVRPRGHASSGGRTRTCLSRLTVARRTDSTTPDRALQKPRHVTERKERESNPQGREAHPFSRRDTAPVAVLPGMAPAGVEPAPSRVRTGSSAVLSYGAEM